MMRGGGGQTQLDSKIIESKPQDSKTDSKITESKLQDSKQDSIDSKKLENSQQINSVDSINQYFIESLPILSLSKQDSKDSKNIESKIPNDLLKILKKPIDSITNKLFETNNCEFLPKLYGIYKNVNEIDFDKLPNKFVLKTNHDCGGVVLVDDKEKFINNKTRFQDSMQKLSKHLQRNYYEAYREYHYKDIKPRIFAEEMLYEIENNKIKIPENFGYFTFKGRDKMLIELDDANYDTTHIRRFYDSDWNFMPFTWKFELMQDDIERPKALNTMNKVAQTLIGDINFIRIDLYKIEEKVYVGELTFTPCGGTMNFKPKEWDGILGEMMMYNRT